MLAVAEVAAIGAVAATAAARSRFEDLGAAALSQCVAGATAIGVGPIAATAIRYGVGAAAVGAAAVGAAAAGAYYGGGGCYDAYGNYICGGGYRPY